MRGAVNGLTAEVMEDHICNHIVDPDKEDSAQAKGAAVIRDTGAILLDMLPDPVTQSGIRQTFEADGDRLTDLHLWRLGPGHLAAIVSVATGQPRGPDFYRQQLSRFKSLSHLTVEVRQG